MRLVVGGGEGGTLIQRHGDGGVEQVLYLDGMGRRQTVPCAVDMRLERDPIGVEFPKLRQGHDLEAAGIGEDWPGPVHEAMQAT